MKKYLVLFAMAASLAALGRDGLYRMSGAACGCNPLPASENLWRSRCAYAPTTVPDDQARAIDSDFFTLEYGEAFSFAKGDFFVRHPDVRVTGEHRVADGALVFSKKLAFTFGAFHGEDEIAAISFGRGWGSYSELHWRLEIDISQATNVTRWTLNGQSFKVFAPTGKRTTVVIPRGLIGESPRQRTALKFVCENPNAEVKLRGIRAVPYVIPGSWRRAYVLNFEPVKAGITLGAHSVCSLKVNGRRLFTGRRTLSGRIEHLDATGFFHKGTNTVLYTANYGGGYGRDHSLTFEGFAVAPDGTTTHLLTDCGWECRWGTNAWRKAAYFNRNGLERMPSGLVIASGVLPMHAGALTATPVERAGYPVFDIEERARWRLTWPATIGAATVTAVVSNALDGTFAMTRTRGPTSVSAEIDFTGLKGGAYEITWTLAANGKKIDTLKSEMLVADALPQDTFPYRDFESALATRLTKLQEVDCSVEDANPTNYVAQRSPHWRRNEDVACVHRESATGLKYRETGSGNGDWFSYKLDVRHPGKAHILEVTYPDTHAQTLYVSINESLPVLFCNNGWPTGARGWPNATGAVTCGGVVPLSGGTKKMRIVFFPGTTIGAVVFSNGGPDRAGVCSFALYEVEGGLPALAIPKTDRLYANHNERPLFGNWGAHVNPRAHENWRAPFSRCWAAAYAAIANRIAFLRYSGHNAAVEGAYMYSGGFPTLSGESSTLFPEFDFYYALVKLYRRNAIKLFVGYEYMHSPKLLYEGAYDCSDRDVWATGKRPAHVVDCYGKQVMGYQGMGQNYMNAKVWNSMTNLAAEIYARYAPVGDIAGFWIIDGGWWLPGYPTAHNRTGDTIGYDDDAIEQFERDTGIALGTGRLGRVRFRKRHELLTGRYRAAWYDWRSKRMRDALEAMQGVVSTGANKWKVFAVPDVRYPAKNPFSAAGATPEARTAFHGETMRKAGFDPAIWGKGTDAKAQLVPKVDFQKQWAYPRYESMVNPGTVDLFRRNDALYFSPEGLNERSVAMRDKNRDWWFRSDGVTVYDVKPAGEAAFCDLIDVFALCTPRYVFHTWLDVNCTTAHAEETRRLLTGFYATPCCDFAPFDGVTGAEGRLGDGCVQIVNDTPWPVSGTLTAHLFEAEDAFLGTFSGTRAYTLPPFGVTCVKGTWPSKLIRASFRFASDVEAAILERAERTLEDRILVKELPADRVAKIEVAFAAHDVYALAVLFRDWEVRRVVEPFERANRICAGTPVKTLIDLKPETPLVFSEKARPGLPPMDPKYASPDGRGARTLTMRVRFTGTEVDALFGSGQLRFDVTMGGGEGRMAFTGFPKGSGWFTVQLPETKAFDARSWHVLTWTVDPLGPATLWVDGVMRHAGTTREFASGPVARVDSRLNPITVFKNGSTLQVSRLIYREGILPAAQIRAEAELLRAEGRKIQKGQK